MTPFYFYKIFRNFNYNL